MMSDLLDKQQMFSVYLVRLLTEAIKQGFRVTLGEAWRSPEQAALYAAKGAGILRSLHTSRLAVDLLLFRDGVYLTDSEAYRPLGEAWETMHPLARWGGRFKRPDGNHFSFEHNGVR